MGSKFILLHSDDNVLVCCQNAKTGYSVRLDNEEIVLTQDIEIAHKLSRFHLNVGDKVLKYGVSIGSATQAINPGEHVHLHNMKSDYVFRKIGEDLQDLSKFK